MSENPRVTVYDVITAATDAGDWVNGEFEAVVRNATAGQGRKPSKADLHDPTSPNIKIAATWFGGDFVRLSGSTCLFHGQGMKTKTYRGTPELSMGDKVMVNVTVAAPEPTSRNAAPTTNAGRAPTPRTPPPPASPEDTAKHFHKTMKKISLLWLHSRQYVCDIIDRDGGEFTEALEQAAIASVFITAKDQGLLDRLPALRAVAEDGGIAPFVPAPPKPADPAEAERVAAEAAARAKREAEEKAKQQAALDEDVPF